MPTYLMLMNATAEGSRKVSDLGSRFEDFKKDIKKAGGKLVGAYALLGTHDYAAIVDVPSEKELVRLSLGIGKRGGSQVESYRAIPLEEFVDWAKEM